MKRYRKGCQDTHGRNVVRFNRIMLCALIPIIIATLTVYGSIERMLMSFLEAEGANLVQQIASAMEMYSNQFESEMRRVGSQDEIDRFINYPSGSYYEALRPENAVDNDLLRNYDYIKLKSQLSRNLLNIKDLGDFVLSVALVDERKNLMLLESGAQRRLSDIEPLNYNFATPYKYEIYATPPELRVDGLFTQLDMFYNIDSGSCLMVSVNYSAMLDSLVAQLPKDHGVLLAATNSEGAVCWSTAPVPDKYLPLLSALPKDGSNLFWSDDGQQLGVRDQLPGLNSELVGVYEKNTLFTRLKDVTTMLLIMLMVMLVYFFATLLFSSRFFSRQLRNIRRYLSGEGARTSRLIDLEDIYDTIDAINDRHNSLARQLSDSLPVHRQQFVAAWLTGSLQPEDLDASLSYFGLDMRGMYLLLLSGDRLPQFSALRLNELEDALTPLLNHRRSFVTRLPSDQLAVILEWDRDDSAALRELAQRLTVRLEEITGVYYFAAISRWTEEFRGLRQAFRDATTALRFRGVTDSGQVVCADDISRTVSTAWIKEERKLQLCEAIGSGNIEESLRLYDGLNDESGESITLNDARNNCVWIYGAVLETLARFGVTEAPFMDLSRALSSSSYHSLRIAFRQFVCEAAEQMEKTLSSRSGQFLDAISEAIARLPVDELSLERVSEEMDVSPTHLSHTFRQCTGQRFIDHLTELRLRRAEELLSGTTMLVQEVAVAVGWSKVSYFTTLFKQRTGMSPTEYRKSCRRPNNNPD